ncbi:hypothetical protein LXA43DRAFT_1148586 [Ganoderma leucocontextum]|nr:hypothetical protein LXA43DRAFT_1148586 [Ganoderma leucocontextum]
MDRVICRWRAKREAFNRESRELAQESIHEHHARKMEAKARRETRKEARKAAAKKAKKEAKKAKQAAKKRNRDTIDVDGTATTLSASSTEHLPILPRYSRRSRSQPFNALFDQTRDGGADLHKPGLLVAIVAPLPRATLRDLDLSVGVARTPPTARTALPLAQFLRPSFQLRGLRAFRLKFTGLVELSADDDAFAELAAASLQTLQLDSRAWQADGPVPTPLVLLSLARSCADLQKLVLPYLDHTLELKRLPPQDALQAAAHPLRHLFIADDRSKENITSEAVDAISGFVGGLFPHLSPHFRRYLRGPGKAWTEVFGRLRAGHDAAA